MMDETKEYINEVLASVFLWDVKQETTTLMMAVSPDMTAVVKKELEEKGYKVTIEPESYYHNLLSIKRK